MENYEEPNEELETDDQSIMVVIESLTASLVEKRDRAIEYRASSGVERRWREDDAAFDGDSIYSSGGTDMMDYASGQAPLKTSQGANRSKVVVNVIRGKCETAEGRFSDILLPVDDKNWGLETTPVPSISEAMKDKRLAAKNGTPIDSQGNPTDPENAITISDVAKMDLDKIEKQMKAMEREIDDQLTECNYNAETRKQIKEASRLGTGILKGPNVVKNIKKKYAKKEDGTWGLEVKENFQPESYQVSCWNVFPDPDCEEDISRASYIWERSTILPRELADLIGVPGYIDSQIIKTLKERPIRLTTGYDDKQKKSYTRYQTVDMGNLYEGWEYYGDLSRDDLEAMGVDLDHDEYSQMFSACVFMVNNNPIKVCLNTLDTGELPYDFFPWTIVTGSPWGVGLPRIMMWLQRIITAAWRAMMDNAGDSSGVNVAISDKLEPADGKYELTGKKLWIYTEDEAGVDMNKLFAQFQVANNQPMLQNIIELALKFLDMETAIPMIFQGEQQKIPETLGATNIMVDANNVALRSRVKEFDDRVTDRHLKRYYHWNMQYNPKEEIKGDFSVDARGTSVLLQKDQQAKTLTQVMALKGDKDVARAVDWEKAIKNLFAALGLDILKSEDELKRFDEMMQKQPPPQDPRVETAKIRSDTDLKKAQLVQQSDINEIQTKGALSEKDLQFKADQAERDRQHELVMKKMEYDMKMMEFAEKRNMSLEQIKAKLSGEVMKNKTKIKTDTDKLNVQVALTDQSGRGPGGIVTPVVEPPQRAEDGKSFIE